MNYAEKLFLIVFLLAIIAWQAMHQAELFKKNITISHFWKGMVYAGAVGIITIPYVYEFGWWYLLKIPILGVLERMALFDCMLNLARPKPFFYNGDKSTGSFIDKLENNISEDLIPAYKIGWILMFIFLTIAIN